MEIAYHKATEKDISTLVDVRIQFAIELAGERAEAVKQELREQMTHYFTKATADGTCISFIATYGNENAGIGSMIIREQPGNFKNLSGRWGYIMNMYTVSAFRRRGICSGILKELVEEGRKMGVTAFELHATASGEPVYLKNGFQLHREPTLRKFISR